MRQVKLAIFILGYFLFVCLASDPAWAQKVSFDRLGESRPKSDKVFSIKEQVSKEAVSLRTRKSHPVRPHPLKSDQFVVEDSFYRVEFLPDGIVYFQKELLDLGLSNLRRKPDDPAAKTIAQLQFRLTEAKLSGGARLWDASRGPSHRQTQENRVIYQRTEILSEVYEARSGAIKQNWIIQELPVKDLTGQDLLIEGRLTTTLVAHLSDKKTLRFYDPRIGYVATYGEVLVVDSEGKSLTVEPAYDPKTSRLMITVPADWLSQATFPVTVDPLIGNETAISVASQNQSSLDNSGWVAYANGVYLVVWEEYDTDRTHIKAARIRALDGMVLDPNGFSVDTLTFGDYAYRPSVTSDGTNFFVVWFIYQGTSRVPGVYGKMFGSDALPVGPLQTLTTSGCPVQPVTAYTGGYYLAVWSENCSSPSVFNRDLYAVRVRAADGVKQDSQSIRITDTSTAGIKSVAGDGSNFLIVWEDSRNDLYGNTSYDIFGAMVRASDGGVLHYNGFEISTAPGLQFLPDVAFNNTNNNYMVVWEDFRSSPPRVYGARVTPAGSVLDSGGIPISEGNREMGWPSIAYGLGRYLVVWEYHTNGFSTNVDLYGTRIKPDGTAINPTMLAISTWANNQRYPAVAFDGNNYLVVWQDYRSGSQYDIYGQLVSGISEPVVTTGTASNIAQTSATLTGVANPDGLSGSAWFEYGLSTSLGLNSNTVAISGPTDNQVNITLNNLSPGTTYYYRIVASSSAGMSYGNMGLFFTASPGSTADPALKAHYRMESPDGKELTASSGMVGLWHFNENSGTTAQDASGNNHTGTYGGGVVQTTAGKFARALSFDGVNDDVQVANTSALQISGSLTLEAWINPSATATWRPILRKGGNGALNYRFQLGPNHILYFDFETTTSYYSLGSTLPLPTNTWSHVAATYDGAMMRIYINGVERGNRAASGALKTSSTQVLSIGRDIDQNVWYSGLLDEVKLYNRVLSPSEIAVEAASSDSIPPSASITVPPAGSNVSGTVAVTASASDNIGVARVEFYLDGNLMSTDYFSPYQWDWNTGGSTIGSHSLVARAYDGSNNRGESTPITVMVVNTGTIAGVVRKATDSTPIANTTVQAIQNGQVIAQATTASNGTYSLSSLGVGTYSVKAMATGYVTQSTSGVNVAAAATTTVDFSLSLAGTVTYKYDTGINGIGRLASVLDSSGETFFDYDKMGRIVQTLKKVDGNSYYTKSSYDALGRVTQVVYPDNSRVNYLYNGPFLKDVYEPGLYYAQYLGHNALGQPGSVIYGNGVSTTYTYANINNTICPQHNFRLCTLLTTFGSSTYQNLHYSYDAGGNILSITDPINGNQTFEYQNSQGIDDLDRLNKAIGPYGTITYSYDQIGNMTSNSRVGSYSYPTNGVRPHAVIQAGGNTYSYDANGNLISGAGRTIRYDHENRPISITIGTSTTTFVYDGDGGRVKKIANGVTTTYIGKLYECTPSGCSKYIFAGDQRIAVRNGLGELYYYHGDHLGSSTVITKGSGSQTGQKYQELAYEPYGATRMNSLAPASGLPHKYTGQELDDSTGLYFYGARYYDPVLGRFISADTIVPRPGDPQSLNRYSYVRNNPILLSDPTGHCEIICIIVIGAVIGGVSSGVQSDWNPQATFLGAVIGAASAGVGFGVGSVASGIVTSMLSNALGETGAGFIGGVAGGAAGGAAAGAMSAGLYRVAGYDLDIGQATWMGAAIGGGLSFLDELSWLARKTAQGWAANNPANTTGRSPGIRWDNTKTAGCLSPCTKSPFGGTQGGPGKLGVFRYDGTQPDLWNRFADRIAESFAGVHDFLSRPLYNINAGTLNAFGQHWSSWIYSGAALVPGAPFGLTTFVQPAGSFLAPGVLSASLTEHIGSHQASGPYIPYGQTPVFQIFMNNIYFGQAPLDCLPGVPCAGVE